jgi:hypothetical protein
MAAHLRNHLLAVLERYKSFRRGSCNGSTHANARRSADTHALPTLAHLSAPDQQ